MEDDTKNVGSNNITVFNLICGLSSKNGMTGMMPGISTIPEIIGYADGKVLDLRGFNSLLVVDLDYFIDHEEEIVDMVKDQIKCRDGISSTKDKSTQVRPMEDDIISPQ